MESMSAIYRKLLADWREAADETRKAQAELRQKIDTYLESGGPEPAQSDVDRLHALRDAESARLRQAMDYLRRTTTPPPTRQ